MSKGIQGSPVFDQENNIVGHIDGGLVVGEKGKAIARLQVTNHGNNVSLYVLQPPPRKLSLHKPKL
jgi:hypothetical protein